MLIKQITAQRKENSKTCTLWEYNFKNKEVGLSCAKINGQYPLEGMAINTTCDLIYFVVSGSGVVHIDNKIFEINQQDALLIKKNKAYFVTGKDLFIAIIESPKWTLEQYQTVSVNI
jgi:mannose-6-phosphate isomerase-like protein (cupin superfamily)